MNKIFSVTLGLLSIVSAYSKSIPLYNSGFEVWERTNVYSTYYMDMASGWDIDVYGWPIDLRKTDNYHTQPFMPHSGNYALYFFDTSYHRPVKTKSYTLSEGTYTYSIYATQMGWANTYITLTVSGGISKSERFAVTERNGTWQKFSLSFTLEEESTVLLGLDNVKTWDGNGTITHYIADDCSLETTDGTLIRSEYDYSPQDDDNYTFYVYTTGDAELVRCKNKGISGKVEIPSKITKGGQEYKVRRICDNAFDGCTNVEEVLLPYYIESIGREAFANCTALTTVLIQNKVSSIGKDAFKHCDKLSVVEFFTKIVPSIEDNVFPENQDLYLYVPNVLKYQNLYSRIRTIAYNSREYIYNGEIPEIDILTAPNTSVIEIDKNGLGKNAGVYYLPATFGHSSGITVEGTVPIVINKKDLMIYADNKTRFYGDANPTFTASYDGFVGNENENFLESKPTLLCTCTPASMVGDYDIVVNNAISSNYSMTYKNGVLTIAKAPLTAQICNASKQYGSENPVFEVVFTGLKNGEITPAWVDNWQFHTVVTTKTDVGQYEITATGTPYNYSLTIKNGLIVVIPAPLTIKTNDASRLYFEPNPKFDCSYFGFVNNDDKQVITKSPAFNTDATQASNVGNYEVIPSGAEAKNYDIVYESGVLTIKKRSLTATSHCSRPYGEENPVLPVEYEGFVNDETESILSTKPVGSTTATKISKVGEYPITISGGDAVNYDFVYEQGILTVTKAALSAKVSDATKVYGENNPTFTIEYYGLKNGETVPTWTTAPTFKTDATRASGVGQYTISAVNGVAVNYDMNIDDGMLTVTQAPLTLKANDATRKYYEEEPEFTYTCSGFVNDDDTQVLTKTPTITTDATKSSCVGKYQITPSDAEAKNYAINYEQGELAIVKRSLTATSHCSRSYGEDNPVFPIEYDGFVNNESESVLSIKPTGTTTATKTSKVGEYPITISGGEAMNYDFVYKKGVLTVIKATLSAKVNDATKVYGENNPAFTIEYYGLKNGETVPTWTTAPTFKTDATKASGVGQYAVSAIDGVSVNYDLAIDDGTLTITPAPLTIQAKNVTRQYYSENPTFSYGCSGFVNGDDKSVLTLEPTLSSSASLTSNVGEYNIEVNGASSTNYSISYVNGTLTVTPRTLMASVGNYDRIYNEENPEFEVKYDGFVGNDDENVLISKAIASTIATKTSDVGSYTINVTGGSADNYKFSYTSGTLTINKAEQAISWEQDLSNLKVGDQMELQAVASSGLPITYKMDSNDAAEIYSAGNNKTYLDCKAEGQFTIRATQEGNKNYYSSTRINKTVTIGNGESAVKSLDNASIKIQRMPFGIRVLNAKSGDFIRIYSADGVLQRSVKVEGEITDIRLSNGAVYVIKVGTRTMKIGL